MIKNDLPKTLVTACAACVVIIIIFMAGFIIWVAFPTFLRQGLVLVTGQVWNYSTGVYGGLAFIASTLILTVVTMLIAVPSGLLAAIFMAEFAPSNYRNISRPMIELLVGIPSVVYGIFGLFVLEPIFREYINPFINSTLGFIPIFHSNNLSSGNGILLSSCVLSIMILPTIIAVSEEAIRSVPREYVDASQALGATKWETVKKVILPVAAAGIVAAVVLGMMRAVGETMAVIMLMGNNPHIPTSILDTGYTMTSKIYTDSSVRMIVDSEKSAMFSMAALLFGIEMLLVLTARMVTRKRKVTR